MFVQNREIFGSSAYLRTIVENLYRVYYNDFKYF